MHSLIPESTATGLDRIIYQDAFLEHGRKASMYVGATFPKLFIAKDFNERVKLEYEPITIGFRACFFRQGMIGQRLRALF
jgi:hypothetical protein